MGASLVIDAHKDAHTASIVLHGEADIATCHYLAATLTKLHLEDAAAIQVDVADLEFCDVGSLEQLLLFAREMRSAGRAVTTRGARPIFRRLADLLGVTHDLGIA